jgi:crossover junction endodeoxyribonuclease RusA
MTLTIEVLGDPVPQGSKRAFPVYRGKGEHREFTGKVAVTDNAGARLAEWRQSIIAVARDAMGSSPPLEGPVWISLEFWLRQPKRPKFEHPATRPDAEKLARAVDDALKAAGVYRDDGQIVTATIRKRYTTGTPGVVVTVREETGP